MSNFLNNNIKSTPAINKVTKNKNYWRTKKSKLYRKFRESIKKHFEILKQKVFLAGVCHPKSSCNFKNYLQMCIVFNAWKQSPSRLIVGNSRSIIIPWLIRFCCHSLHFGLADKSFRFAKKVFSHLVFSTVPRKLQIFRNLPFSYQNYSARFVTINIFKICMQ